jgi:hypothetical protein
VALSFFLSVTNIHGIPKWFATLPPSRGNPQARISQVTPLGTQVRSFIHFSITASSGANCRNAAMNPGLILSTLSVDDALESLARVGGLHHRQAAA